MSGVLIGFAIIGSVILVGYVVQRAGILPGEAQRTLNRLAFFVSSPALLFTVLARADVHVIFSSFLVVTLLSVVVTAGIFVLLSRLFFRRGVAETTIAAAASSYVNANNIGLPVATYVLGDPQFVAPLLMLQLIVIAPLVLTLLDASRRGSVSVRSIVTQPLRNPIIIASIAGLIVALSGWKMPDALLQPFQLIGGSAIPLVLITFGMSLSGQRPLAPGTGRREIVTATVLKSIVMPVVAYLAGRYLVNLDGVHLFGVVVLAALPTAQNIFNFAHRYEVGIVVARDVVLLSTIASVPVLLVVAGLLGPQ
ncbi:AEC family transporter [Subtercola vilae]|uniref:AEC family transporter n=1 Tax=Subtercola vilae TaxID=2056433 RepID=A0A4V4RFQ2_9MICO|nr:AEC family transporter [Subtercola vilae]TIH38704.1 AEC family transporter [Subtercola vilae]